MSSNLAARNARAEARIQNHHMAVVNAQSISDDELQASKFKNYKMGGLEQYHLTHLSDNQRLVYFPNMESSEILVFKQGAYDVSDTNIVTPLAEPHKHHILHTAFLDPTAPRGTVPRKAIACPGVLVVLKAAEPKSDDKGDAKNQRVQKGDARSTLLHRTGLAPSWKKELKQTFPPEEWVSVKGESFYLVPEIQSAQRGNSLSLYSSVKTGCIEMCLVAASHDATDRKSVRTCLSWRARIVFQLEPKNWVCHGMSPHWGP